MKKLIVIALFLVSPGVAAPMPTIQIPDRTFKVTDYGAASDGSILCTDAIKKAVEACLAAGGGMVEFPAGKYLTGPFSLGSNLDLHLDDGATILFSDKPTDYKVTNHRVENCLVAVNCHDLKISGQGTIDGQGAFWWKNYVLPKNAPAGTPQPDHRPFMVAITDCQRVRVEGVTLTNSPMFHLVPQGCRDVSIENVTIQAPANAPNTDGIDPSGFNFHISKCTIDVGDDNIAIKPSRRIEADKPSCMDFDIEDCTFRHGHGMSIGNPTPGGLKGLIVKNCTFENTDTGIRMKTSRSAGAVVEDCTYDNLTMKNVKNTVLITDYYPTIPQHPEDDPAQPVTDRTPIFRHIHISNVTATGDANAGQIIGLAEMPIEDVTFDHVNISAHTGMRIIHAKGIKFDDCNISVETGAILTEADAEVAGLH